MGAIQNFETDDITVAAGTDSDAVVVDVFVQPVDSVEKIYITVNFIVGGEGLWQEKTIPESKTFVTGSEGSAYITIDGQNRYFLNCPRSKQILSLQ